jgi:hypothetical protein
MKSFARWLAASPYARLKLASFIGLCWLTAIAILVALARGVRVDPDLLVTWLAFVAAVGGIGTAQFLSTRTTFRRGVRGAQPKGHRGPRPASPPPRDTEGDRRPQ